MDSSLIGDGGEIFRAILTGPGTGALSVAGAIVTSRKEAFTTFT